MLFISGQLLFWCGVFLHLDAPDAAHWTSAIHVLFAMSGVYLMFDSIKRT